MSMIRYRAKPRMPLYLPSCLGVSSAFLRVGAASSRAQGFRDEDLVRSVEESPSRPRERREQNLKLGKGRLIGSVTAESKTGALSNAPHVL